MIGVRMPQLNRGKPGRRQRDNALGGDCLADDLLKALYKLGQGKRLTAEEMQRLGGPATTGR